MSRWKSILIAVVAILAGPAIGTALVFWSIAERSEPQVARQVIASLASGDWKSVTPRLGPSYRRFDPQTVVEEMAALLPEGTPDSITIEKSIRIRDTDGRLASWITLDCRYPDNDPVRARLLLKGSPDDLRIEDFRLGSNDAADAGGNGPVVELSRPEQAPSLPLGWSHLIFVVLTPAVFVLSATEFVLAVKRYRERDQIWHALGALVGVGVFWLDWPTGWWGFWPFSIQMPLAGFSAESLSGPWSFGFSIPVGAIYVRHRRLKRLEAEALKAACAALPPSDNAFSGPGAGNENTGGLAPAGDSKS